MAKDLVRTRHSITKFYGLKSQLQGVSLRMQTLKSTQAMADAMRGVTRAMASMNKQLNLPSLNNIMREFERQNEKMESTTEVMGDAIDDAMAVIRVASGTIQEHASESVKAAMIEVHLFVVNPTQQQREPAKAHAATARKGFLFGGLLHDCLSVILNVEHGCVQQMIYFAKEFARQHPEEAAWDAAMVAGAI